MLNNSYPIMSRLLVWVIAPVVVALISTYIYLRQSLPETEGRIALHGLASSVEIYRDVHAVPHIRAATDRDAFFAIGYLHAQDRMWQMEYQRRLGQGRLSEVLGSDSLRSDQFMRTLGLYRAAQTALSALDGDTRRTLQAYADGVNAWINRGRRLPIEYHILGFEPEPWLPEDSLLQIKLMARNLEFNYAQELQFDMLVNEVGLAKAADLMPGYPSGAVTVTRAAEPVDATVSEQLLAYHELQQRRYGLGVTGLGSNGWVVAGALTDHGKPLLANDPHLATDIPSVWYLAEIQGDRLHVSGATYPGLPFVILGHNDAIAWGGTALGADVQDLYMERVNPQNEDEYEVDGQWVPMVIEQEWIRVKSEFPSLLTDPVPPLQWEVRKTRHGPLISDVIGRVDRPLALRWTALDAQDNTYRSFLQLNYAQNWQEFKAALEDYLAPTLNFLYADRQGNIAYIAAGKIPIRRQGDGRLPVPGWQFTHDWDTYIPLTALPQSFNPPSGYIVSANNKNHAADYPYLISNSWAPPYRAERISRLIEGRIQGDGKLSVADFVEIQGDFKSLQAEQLMRFLSRVAPTTPQQKSALEFLKGWDGTMSEASAEAALYQAWFRHFNRSVLNDDLRGDLLHPDRLDRLLNFAESLNPVLINELVSQKQTASMHNWCDHIHTERVETCEVMALEALDKAVDDVISLTQGRKKWGDIHKTYYRHRGFGEVQLLDHLFDREIANGGDGYSVNVGGWTYSKDKGYQQLLGPSYRQVIDLHDWNQSLFINSTGQSGNIFSEHYDDNISRNKQMTLLTMNFGAEATAPGASVLVLEPGERSRQE
ncbi:penicillin acylase family protein [Exilibacterium tricleocarpae]|nr:penicillin acylase family protein [Exilibacterium tricleocarpae]